MQTKNVYTQLSELAKHAKLIKNNPLLRYNPNQQDIQTASENAHLMQPYQYQVMKQNNGDA